MTYSNSKVFDVSLPDLNHFFVCAALFPNSYWSLPQDGEEQGHETRKSFANAAAAGYIALMLQNSLPQSL